ncbi:DUF1156 domain-containing protein [Gordonia polyisoprenivorans]|uniref:DUF1156 domain-containing protein n=1 Tax=Gordonia polyisoprenivorans TaxID=84595 RepID=UPI000B99D5F4|nr:DUF1156 domain-containing protein [Gordonia polyisoprenivorans]OZC29685.1 hypothetical protein CJJ17_23660 [Gordonia polyisoprenivorans]QUD81362.1 DUF1156 domain-containing protein [Gordonia polyisoprenivorans]
MPGDAQQVGRRKLIEVSIPLQTINQESVREKQPFTRNHPRSLHPWWSRKPLVIARSVLFAQLVDDPSTRPDLYPTKDEQQREKKKLFEIMERLAVWENSNNESLLKEAHQKILESTDGNPPAVIDIFAGGGSIPLEAQRLGLEAHAADLNPVAVLINKALIEIPSRFIGSPPVSLPTTQGTAQIWPRSTGLAEDVQNYGRHLRRLVEQRVQSFYPKKELADGRTVTVTAWIWARIVTCPNPECRIDMPLTSKWWLAKKKGKEAFVAPIINGTHVTYRVTNDHSLFPKTGSDGTVGRHGAICIRCGAAVDFSYIRAEGQAGSLRERLIAIAAEGPDKRRIYLSADDSDQESAETTISVNRPLGKLPDKALGFRVQAYGFKNYADLFSNRQAAFLEALFGELETVRTMVQKDALAADMPPGEPLDKGGSGANAYAEAVTVYLALAASRYSEMSSTLCSWNQTNENIRSAFSLHAVPMIWDYAEVNPIGRISIENSIKAASSTLRNLRPIPGSSAFQEDSQAAALPARAIISTDPPYYASIGYADLSDFFYIWLRSPLKSIYPSLFTTLLVPKQQELVANQFRHHGSTQAREFFVAGFTRVFENLRDNSDGTEVATVYYAQKEGAADLPGTASGWETVLEAIIRSGWTVKATWPMRSERPERTVARGSNALASSILLALRPRSTDAPRIDRRGFLSALRNDLPLKLRELQQGSIAPVDLPQATIGPGMEVFSQYSQVIDDDGKPMTVSSALQSINAVLDEVLTELENDYDKETRFALTWFRQSAFATGRFGDAESVANARGVNLDELQRDGILTKGGGKVALIAPSDMPADYDPSTDTSISQWEVVMHLTRTLADSGVPAAAALLGRVPQSVDWDLCKELASLLFKLAEDQKKTKLAVDFNNLGAAWNDIARQAPESSYQPTLME